MWYSVIASERMREKFEIRQGEKFRLLSPEFEPV